MLEQTNNNKHGTVERELPCQQVSHEINVTVSIEAFTHLDSSKSCSRIATFTASLAAISIDPKGREEKSPSALRVEWMEREEGRGMG